MRRFLPLLPMLVALASPASAQMLEPATRALNFGTVAGDAAAERTLKVTNRGTAAAHIRNVQLTPPLSVTKMQSTVEPGASTEIVVKLGTPRPSGRYEGQLLVNFEGNGEPLAIDVNAILVTPIEITPKSELVAVTERGKAARASVEIESHLDHPVHLTGGSVSNDRYTTSLEAIDPGHRYRLTLDMPGDGPAGKRVEVLTLATDDPAYPAVKVHARTMLRERVYTFPDTVDFGSISRGRDLSSLDMSVMVYQKDGKDFQVMASTDLPFLKLRPEKSPVYGDRWQIFLSLDASRLTPGQASGTITIGTNDPEFVLLRVPVTAVVE